MEETNIADLLTINEAARKMHVTRQTIYMWIANGKILPVTTPGGRLRIPEEQLILETTQISERENDKDFDILDISDVEPIQDEQMGTKRKFWFETENWQFLFKVGRDNTGDNWAEKVASELCELIRLPHAEYELAVWRKAKGVVSPTFVPVGAQLRPGNEILARIMHGYEVKKRYKQRKHLLRLVMAIMEDKELKLPIYWSGLDGIHSAADVFVGYLMLDAWIANQDRHHENWAHIVVPKGGTRSIHLAPSYDHASSFGSNETDTNRKSRLTTRDKGWSMEKYVKRARSAFYSITDGNRPLSTIDAFQIAASRKPEAARIWLKQLSGISSSDTLSILERIPETEITDIGIEFTQKLLDLNRERLLKLEI
jgi:excisionase family DNA binding protein